MDGTRHVKVGEVQDDSSEPGDKGDNTPGPVGTMGEPVRDQDLSDRRPIMFHPEAANYDRNADRSAFAAHNLQSLEPIPQSQLREGNINLSGFGSLGRSETSTSGGEKEAGEKGKKEADKKRQREKREEEKRKLEEKGRRLMAQLQQQRWQAQARAQTLKPVETEAARRTGERQLQTSDSDGDEEETAATTTAATAMPNAITYPYAYQQPPMWQQPQWAVPQAMPTGP